MGGVIVRVGCMVLGVGLGLLACEALPARMLVPLAVALTGTAVICYGKMLGDPESPPRA